MDKHGRSWSSTSQVNARLTETKRYICVLSSRSIVCLLSVSARSCGERAELELVNPATHHLKFIIAYRLIRTWMSRQFLPHMNTALPPPPASNVSTPSLTHPTPSILWSRFASQPSFTPPVDPGRAFSTLLTLAEGPESPLRPPPVPRSGFPPPSTPIEVKETVSLYETLITSNGFPGGQTTNEDPLGA